MSEFVEQRAASRAHGRVFASPLVAIAAAILCAGCAASKGASTEGSQTRLASAHPAASEAGTRVEVEDDGLPVQAPPRWRTSVEPDDPREPYSRNYGHDPVPAPKAVRPTRVSAADADAIVAQAVAAHEIRRQ